MKFKFCADGDCPLWALAALHALGSLPAQLFRALLQRVLDDQPLACSTGHTVRRVKPAGRRVWCVEGLTCGSVYNASDLTGELLFAPREDLGFAQDDGIMEILKDTSLASREECARAAATVRWVLRSAWACSCPGAQLAKDLAVLGVPRAHATALAEAADEHRQAYVDTVQSNGFTVNKLTDITVSSAPAGTIDAYKLTLHSDNIAGEQKRRELLVERSQANTLLEELKKAYKKIEELEAQG